MKIQIKAGIVSGMSNRQYHANGKPTWWACEGKMVPGRKPHWLPVDLRGDNDFKGTFEVADDTKVITVGVGPNNRHGVRATITITPEMIIG